MRPLSTGRRRLGGGLVWIGDTGLHNSSRKTPRDGGYHRINREPSACRIWGKSDEKSSVAELC